MGSSGSFLKSGGFSSEDWEQVGVIKGVKVLRSKKAKIGTKGNLPMYSKTPGTAYLLLNPDGSFGQYREYGEDRRAKLDVDYGIHGGTKSLHIHKINKNGERGEPTIIAYPGGDIINTNLYNKYKAILKGVKL